MDQLAHQVASEVEAYRVPPSHPDQLGSPLPLEWFERGLAEMRSALVRPYPIDVVDLEAKSDGAPSRSVIVVADDRAETLLAFDPAPDGDFALVWRRVDGLVLSNIRGDAVGCFLSR